jgi:membrane protease YdiL (CAAX protease family)
VCGTRAAGNFCGACGASLSSSSLSPTPERSLDEVGPFTELRVSDRDHRETVSPSSSGDTGNDVLARTTTGDSRDARASKYTPEQRALSWEMRCVMFAFLSAGIVGAVLVLVEHVSGLSDITRFPQIVSNQVLNMFIGMLSYAPTMAVVPIALFLLARTGQTRSVLGIGAPSWKEDIFPALGIGAAAFGVEIVLFIPFAGLLSNHPGLLNSVADGNFPKYYLIEGIFMSAVTAVTEEVLVNGYFLTRLQQLGWSPRSALIVSLVFRTSYHVYYGIGFLFTIPFGYFVTRSFQKHQRLNRPIWAHFLYDAILFSISILK